MNSLMKCLLYVEDYWQGRKVKKSYQYLGEIGLSSNKRIPAMILHSSNRI